MITYRSHHGRERYRPHGYRYGPQPRGRTTPSSSWESATAMKMVVESMEMAPGALPRPGRVPEQRLLSPETCRRWRRRCRCFFGIWWGPSRFYASGAIYRRKGGVGGLPWAPHHLVARQAWVPRHPMVWPAHGPPGPLLRAPCSPLNYKTAAFCPVQFREYFLKYFSETEKQQKTGTGTVASC